MSLQAAEPVIPPRSVLGHVVHGCAFPSLPPGELTVPVPLAVLDGDPVETWTCPGAVSSFHVGSVQASMGDGLMFGTLASRHDDVFEAARQAYLDLFDFLASSPCRNLLRVWNYVPRITAPDLDGVERYRRFNMGRYEAFAARKGDGLDPPAATGIGTLEGQLVIYFIAGAQAGTTIENPRQVSAFRYPAQYGPRSPTFSRSLLAPWQEGRMFFVSGTASIVGHETRHAGNVLAQTREALLNIRTLLERAERERFEPDFRGTRLKIYVRDALDLAIVRHEVEAAFPRSQAVYLQAEICRTDLLVEIEGAFPG